MRSDSDEDFSNLNKFLNNQDIKNSRDQKSNQLCENNSKAKSVPANQRIINEDHLTFGQEGCDIMNEEDQEISAFER